MEQPSHIRHYNKNLKEFANTMRNSSTKAETWLWKFVLSKKQLKGYTFNRQRPVLNYIADFMCKQLKLVIEADGITHYDDEVQTKDFIKTQNLINAGYTVLRFTDNEIIHDLDLVKKRIEDVVEELEQKSSVIPPLP